MKIKLLNIRWLGFPVLFLLFQIAIIKGSYPQKASQKPEKMQVITTNPSGSGPELELTFHRGPAHNHPLMAVWVEDTAGNYLQTLYVARSIATGTFNYAADSSGKWTRGEIRRPAALPYWSHKRGIKADDGLFMPTPDNPVPDAYSGATPKKDFVLTSRLDHDGPTVFNILFEINQPWDWNEYWTNSKFPGNEAYQSSSQPAVVYMATVDLAKPKKVFPMKVAGHSHYAGEDGRLYEDISTLTTALQIAKDIEVRVK